MQSIIERLLKLRCRQLSNDNLKSVLHLGPDRFYDLFSEIQKMTCPAFSMPQKVWDFWLQEIMPKFVEGNNIHILGYEIRMLSN